MNIRRLTRAGLLGIASVTLIIPLHASVASDDEDVPFSTYVSLGNEHVLPDTGDSVVRAFVLTRSAKPNCLVTPGESNNAVAGVVVFCGVRNPTIYGGKPGIMITAFFPGPVPDPLVFTLTLHQDGARMYGPAVPCAEVDGC
jgi:hypothetical protein